MKNLTEGAYRDMKDLLVIKFLALIAGILAAGWVAKYGKPTQQLMDGMSESISNKFEILIKELEAVKRVNES